MEETHGFCVLGGTHTDAVSCDDRTRSVPNLVHKQVLAELTMKLIICQSMSSMTVCTTTALLDPPLPSELTRGRREKMLVSVPSSGLTCGCQI